MTNQIEQKLQAAKAAGIISDEQLGAILAMNDAPQETRVDDEPFALFGGFSEILISIGLAILLTGLCSLSPILTIVASAALSFYFVKVRKLTLPGMILIGFIFAASWISVIDITIIDPNPTIYIFLGAIIFVAMYAYYYVFSFPFALLLTAASAIIFEGLLFSWLIESGVFPDSSADWLAIIIPFLSGLVAISLAIWYDSSDLERVTVNTQKAFWLHVIAAPSMCWPFIMPFLDHQSAITGMISVIGILILALLGLVLDRRSFVTVGLVSFGGLLAYFIEMDGSGISIILLIIGAYALVVGTWWAGIRRGLFGILPQGRWRDLVPHTK